MAFDMSLVGKPTDAQVWSYTWKDTVLYALGIGAKEAELDYLYEGRGPKVYPSFAVVPKFPPMLEVLGKSGGNLAMVVHGGEKVVVHKPFAPAATLKTRATIRGIYDLRRFASMLIDTESRDEKDEVVCTTTSSILFRGEGGFGGETRPKESAEEKEQSIDVPKGEEPHFRIEEATTKEQALLYRLSGDPNPLHADPAFAKSVGFEQGPILHGLCTYGHMVRHVAKAACGGDATQITAFEAQFRRPVWPGDTLVTEGWTVRPGKIALQVKVKERDEVVIAGAWATLR
jgi:acyl dehydratase